MGKDISHLTGNETEMNFLRPPSTHLSDLLKHLDVASRAITVIGTQVNLCKSQLILDRLRFPIPCDFLDQENNPE
jgi:hypothetical protein